MHSQQQGHASDLERGRLADLKKQACLYHGTRGCSTACFQKCRCCKGAVLHAVLQHQTEKEALPVGLVASASSTAAWRFGCMCSRLAALQAQACRSHLHGGKTACVDYE